NLAVDDRRERCDPAGIGETPGDVDVEERDPLVEDLGLHRARVYAVDRRDLHVTATLEEAQHRREAAARLLVLPRAGEAHRHLDATHPLDRRARIHELGLVVRPARRELDRVQRLEAELLVGDADLVALARALARPALAALRRRRGVALALVEPRPREAVVE